MDRSAESCAIAVVASDDGVTIRVHGEVDLASAPLLDAALAGVGGEGEIEVDLSEMTFCDAAGLRVLEQARRRFRQRLRVTGANPMLRRLAEIVEMEWLAADASDTERRYGGESL